MKKLKDETDKKVLVGVLKNNRDLGILLREKWYRIPAEYLPKRAFSYVAFYEPVVFGKHGKRIEYYGKVSNKKILKRIKLLPKEKKHPRAQENYIKIEMIGIEKLPRPIKNIIPRRVSFGFTTLKNLFLARDILELYDVPRTEQIIDRRLKQEGITAFPEFSVLIKGRRFRLDFAIIRNGKHIAVECDNIKAHAGKTQRTRDKRKDFYLRRAGWRVLRFKEKEIIERLDSCFQRIQKAIKEE